MLNDSKVLEMTLQRLTNPHLAKPGTFLISLNLSDPPNDETDLLTGGENSAWCLPVVRLCRLLLVNEEFFFKNQISRDCDWVRNAI